jgi:hypothetical protein
MKKKAKPRRNAAPRSRSHRNASARELATRAGRAVAGAASAARKRLTQPDPPSLQDVLATVVAGGGASVLGGYAVRKGVDPKIVSTGMLIAGLGGAFATKGTLRTAATSIAGAGAGQLALTLMQERAIQELKTAMATVAAGNQNKPATPALDGKPRGTALPPGAFESRLALHQQLNDDSARFTEPEAETYYVDAAA